jgi:ABC-type Fe3+ transport system permease subunit
MTYWSPKISKSGLIVACLLAVCSMAPVLLALVILLSESGLYSAYTRVFEAPVAESLRFTLYQAATSSLLVSILSPFFAIALLSMPKWVIQPSILIRITLFCLPSVIVASGLVMAWGNNGSFTQIVRTFGINPPFPSIIYSPEAIILANSFMNVPFCSVIIFKRILDISDDQLRSATLLGLPPLRFIQYVLWPAIKPTIVYFSTLSFLLSMGSFGALSILGSGPHTQTIEMSIYNSIYYSADWELGGILTILHTILCGLFTILIAVYLNRSKVIKSNPSSNFSRFLQLRSFVLSTKSAVRISRALTILFDALILSPILALSWQAFTYILMETLNTSFEFITPALIVSASYAVPASLAIMTSAWFISRSYYRSYFQGDRKVATAIQILAFTSAVIPPMALGFGFLALQSAVSDSFLRRPSIILALAATTLPFALSVFMPLYGSRLAAANRLRLQLGLRDITFFRKIEWPTISRVFFITLAISLALCVNETSIVSILGDPMSPAMTTTMIRLMNQYRFADSSVIALILVCVTLSVILYLYKSEGQQND